MGRRCRRPHQCRWIGRMLGCTRGRLKPAAQNKERRRGRRRSTEEPPLHGGMADSLCVARDCNTANRLILTISFSSNNFVYWRFVVVNGRKSGSGRFAPLFFGSYVPRRGGPNVPRHCEPVT